MCICYVGRINKNGITEVQHIVFLHTIDLLGEWQEKSELKKKIIYLFYQGLTLCYDISYFWGYKNSPQISKWKLT